MNSLALHASPSLQPVLSPRLQRAVKLLQMSSLDFSRVVRDALDANPFLEADEGTDLDEAHAAVDAGDWLAPDDQDWSAQPLPRARPESTEDGAFDLLTAHTTLADHLVGQLNLLPLSERDWGLAVALAGSLDDDGYLRVPVEEVADSLDLDPLPQPEELAIALRRVQALDPAGVGARSVAECLQLQVPSIIDQGERELALVILSEHLQCLAKRDLGVLTRRLSVAPAQVEAACAAIRRMNPRPGWRFDPVAIQYATPDVIVRRHRDRWTVVLNPQVVPKIRINRDYVDLFARHRKAEHAELSAHLQEAKWTVRNVEQRFSTILAVARAILKRQHRFLAYGAMAMRPLALREIADEVGVHESTVSRVTNNKFVATPYGVFELKYFFSRGLATASGGECSPTAIRGLMQELIAAESPARPLSDVEITRQLSMQGLGVARRTVTKYRQLLKIASAERRRLRGVQAIARVDAA